MWTEIADSLFIFYPLLTVSVSSPSPSVFTLSCPFFFSPLLLFLNFTLNYTNFTFFYLTILLTIFTTTKKSSYCLCITIYSSHNSLFLTSFADAHAQWATAGGERGKKG